MSSEPEWATLTQTQGVFAQFGKRKRVRDVVKGKRKPSFKREQFFRYGVMIVGGGRFWLAALKFLFAQFYLK